MSFGLQFLAMKRLIAAYFEVLWFHIDSPWFFADEKIVNQGFEGFDDGWLGILGIFCNGRPHVAL